MWALGCLVWDVNLEVSLIGRGLLLSHSDGFLQVGQSTWCLG